MMTDPSCPGPLQYCLPVSLTEFHRSLLHHPASAASPCFRSERCRTRSRRWMPGLRRPRAEAGRCSMRQRRQPRGEVMAGIQCPFRTHTFPGTYPGMCIIAFS